MRYLLSLQHIIGPVVCCNIGGHDNVIGGNKLKYEYENTGCFEIKFVYCNCNRTKMHMRKDGCYPKSGWISAICQK